MPNYREDDRKEEALAQAEQRRERERIIEKGKLNDAKSKGVASDRYTPSEPVKLALDTQKPASNNIMRMHSDLSLKFGSRQSPQTFVDGHSETIVTGKDRFDRPPRINPRNTIFSFKDRKSGIQHVARFNDEPEYRQTDFDTLGNLTIFDRAHGKSFFENTTISINSDTKTLQDYYDKALKNNGALSARDNSRLGFDEPFVLKGIGDRWGPGKLGALDAGFMRGGFVTAASRTLADVERITKYLLTPRGIAFIAKQNLLQSQNWMDTNNVPRQVNKTNPNFSGILKKKSFIDFFFILSLPL